MRNEVQTRDDHARSALLRAGHHVREWTDGQIMSLVFTARLRASGERVFVPYNLEPLVTCLEAAIAPGKRR